jgi:RNA polymerase sigma factor (TIGR02999 family)
MSVDPSPTSSESQHLFATLYDELHRLAASHLRRSGSDLTLSTTTVLHEAWLDMAARDPRAFPDRAHFLAYAARAMRAIVIDHARQRRTQKRGEGLTPVTLSPELSLDGSERTVEELSRLSDALDELAGLEPALADLVDLHFFCGYTFAEIAELRGVSERTVQRDWRKTRLLLHHALLDHPPTTNG